MKQNLFVYKANHHLNVNISVGQMEPDIYEWIRPSIFGSFMSCSHLTRQIGAVFRGRHVQQLLALRGGVDDKNKTGVFTNTFVLFLVKLLHLKVKNTSAGFSDSGSINPWHHTHRAKHKMRFLIQNGINQLVHAEFI